MVEQKSGKPVTDIQAGEFAVFARVGSAAGPDYAGVTRVAGFRRKVLEVEVKGAVPLQELSQFHKRKVLAKLREALSGVG